MIYLFICILIGLILGISSAICEGEIANFFMVFILFIVIGFALMAVVGLPIGNALEKEEFITEQQLVPITTIEQGEKFIYIQNNGNNITYKYTIVSENGIEFKEEKLYNVSIIEGSDTPKFVKHTSKFKKSWYWLFGARASGDGEYSEFYVPENGVIYSFK